MRGLLFVGGVLVLLVVAALQVGLLRVTPVSGPVSGAPAATARAASADGTTLEDAAAAVAAEEPPANGTE